MWAIKLTSNRSHLLSPDMKEVCEWQWASNQLPALLKIKLVEAIGPGTAHRLSRRAQRHVNYMQPCRTIDIFSIDNKRTTPLIYQHRTKKHNRGRHKFTQTWIFQVWTRYVIAVPASRGTHAAGLARGSRRAVYKGGGPACFCRPCTLHSTRFVRWSVE